MRVLRSLLALALASMLGSGVVGCKTSGVSAPLPGESWAPVAQDVDGVARLARTEGDKLLLSTVDGDRSFIPGVNIGSTVPGHQPGELAVSAEDYRRWFPLIGGLGIRSIRVYTILPPHFYEELARYNEENASAPLYLVQGVWIPEERFLETQDLYDAEVENGFKDEIADAVEAVHGRLRRDPTPGHASGAWTADVSDWLLAWSVGVEWDPVAIQNSDAINSGRPIYEGEYFSASTSATPTESWLASMLDHLASKEIERGRTMPLTFTNWPTCDPLDHPYEPLENEDLVSIDANHIRPTASWSGGYFASYHAYPYYPDFQRHDPELAEAVRDGEPDPYAGYLAKLREHHAGIPVMITEFGVPSSSGMAHYGPRGRGQGDHSEQEQMSINADLLTVIADAGCAGGYLFEWSDEWFKFTWNTIEYELPPDRRAMWKNPWTNESHFGILAVEPGESEPVVTIDGDVREWKSNGSSTIFEGRGSIRRVRAVKDEAYLYLHIEQKLPMAMTSEPLVLGFDVLDGGGIPLPAADQSAERIAAQQGEGVFDYAIVLRADDTADAFVRSAIDQYAAYHGAIKKSVPVPHADLSDGASMWHRWKLLVNYRLIVPATLETLEPESFEVGVLRKGTSDPGSDEYDSRALWTESGPDIEIRIPWMMIGYSDPSSKQVLTISGDGELLHVDGKLDVSVSLGDEVVSTTGYDWGAWQSVTWHERLKSGSDVYAAAARKLSAR